MSTISSYINSLCQSKYSSYSTLLSGLSSSGSTNYSSLTSLLPKTDGITSFSTDYSMLNSGLFAGKILADAAAAILNESEDDSGSNVSSAAYYTSSGTITSMAEEILSGMNFDAEA